jgi:uncharacterized protein YjbJ (UPF0337 family)
MMNQITWQGKLRQLRGDFKREWGKFTHNDRQRIEGELDRIIGQMQQQYGYTSQRAWNELARYWQAYSKPVRAVVNSKWGRRKQQNGLLQRIGQQVPWLALAFGLLGFILIVAQLRTSQEGNNQEGNNGQPTRATTPNANRGREARQEAKRQESVQDTVDEQSWQSFPASDPPASW